MPVTYTDIVEASEADETICPACGTLGGEAGYECFHCAEATVRSAEEIRRILDLVEKDDERNT